MNSVAPGPIWTLLIPATMPQEKEKKFGKDTPLGRAGQPAELAPVYVLLASIPERREMAARHGVEVVDPSGLESGGDIADALRDLTNGRGPDAVVVLSGWTHTVHR